MTDLFARALACLEEPDPDAKGRQVRELYADWQRQALEPGPGPAPKPIPAPGRPRRPALVPGSRVQRRRLGSPQGRAALIHAVAHIEFNAINLALDAVYRFRGLPRDFYTDWLRVAVDEARHFALLRDHLAALGHAYGDFAAHNGLWEMAVKTAHDPLVRMALVPRVLEARGLDVTPGMIQRLRAAGDPRAADILEVILGEEVGHVAAGSRWFRWLCRERGVDPAAAFRGLLAGGLGGGVKGPLNHPARRAAGFTEPELAVLDAMVSHSKGA